MSKKESLSPVRKFLNLLHAHAMGGTGHSWQRLNGSYQRSLETAIRSGFKFRRDDFARIYAEHNGGYWFGNDGQDMTGESFYRIACEVGNLSACQSFEAWKERPPFLADGKRLHLGAQFKFEGKIWTVTGFKGVGQQAEVGACAYKPTKPGSYTRKIDRRLRLNVEQLREGERAKRGPVERLRKTETYCFLHKDCHLRSDVREAIGRHETVRAWWDAADNVELMFAVLDHFRVPRPVLRPGEDGWTPDLVRRAVDWSAIDRHLYPYRPHALLPEVSRFLATDGKGLCEAIKDFMARRDTLRQAWQEATAPEPMVRVLLAMGWERPEDFRTPSSAELLRLKVKWDRDVEPLAAKYRPRRKAIPA